MKEGRGRGCADRPQEPVGPLEGFGGFCPLARPQRRQALLFSRPAHSAQMGEAKPLRILQAVAECTVKADVRHPNQAGVEREGQGEEKTHQQQRYGHRPASGRCCKPPPRPLTRPDSLGVTHPASKNTS